MQKGPCRCIEIYLRTQHINLNVFYYVSEFSKCILTYILDLSFSFNFRLFVFYIYILILRNWIENKVKCLIYFNCQIWCIYIVCFMLMIYRQQATWPPSKWRRGSKDNGSSLHANNFLPRLLEAPRRERGWGRDRSRKRTGYYYLLQLLSFDILTKH